MSKKPNIRINKVYTRKGDSGKTNLIDKKNLLKSDLRVVCYGEVDELNSSLGFCISLLKKSVLVEKTELFKSMKKIQNDLFNLGTVLAISDIKKLDQFPKVAKKDIAFLESEIDFYNDELEELKSFVLPSGTLAGSYFHVCRTVCRRVERVCVSLSQIDSVDGNVLKYLNRLSDLLFVLSRWANKQEGYSEDLWTP
tara:strand:+ start:190 stop:777 length:588 start_codon:yes stop_codon:yes gene_type:complete